MDAGFYNFEERARNAARPNGHAGGEQPSDWPEPIDILADPQLTGLASVDATAYRHRSSISPSPKAPGCRSIPAISRR